MTDLAALGIRSRVEGADQTQQELDRIARASRNVQTEANRLRTANDNVAGSLRRTAQSIAVLNGPLGGIAGRFSALASVVTSTGVAVGLTSVAIAGLGFAAQRSISAFQEFETQQLVLASVLEATGMSAGRTAMDIEYLAQSIAAATLASTSEVRQASIELSTFDRISGETFDRALRLSQDLATVGFGTMRTASRQLGRALQDPINNLSVFERVGVSFSGEMENTIRVLQETGRVAEAQAIIFERLESRVGGAGEAASAGLAGAWDALGQAIQNNMVHFGQAIVEITRMDEAIQNLADRMNRPFMRSPQDEIDDLSEKINSLHEDINRMVEAMEYMPEGMQSLQPINAAQERLNELYQQRQDIIDTLIEARQAELEEEQRANRERVQGVMRSIELEIERLDLTERQVAVQQALARAEVEASSAEGQAVARLAGRLHDERQAREQAAQAAQDQTRESERLQQARQRELQQQQSVIDGLRHEIEQLGRTAEQQRLYNELRRAGVDINSAAGREIERLVAQLHREEEALNRVADAGSRANAVRQQGIDTIAGSWSQGGGTQISASTGPSQQTMQGWEQAFGAGGFDVNHHMSGRGMGVQGARIMMSHSISPNEQGLQYMRDRHEQRLEELRRDQERALAEAARELNSAARGLQSIFSERIRDTERRMSMVANMPMPRPDPYAERSADVFYDMNAEEHFLSEQMKQMRVLEDQLEELRTADRHLRQLIELSRDNPSRFASELSRFIGGIDTNDPVMQSLMGDVERQLRSFSSVQSSTGAAIQAHQATAPPQHWTIGHTWQFEDDMARQSIMSGGGFGFAGFNRGGEFDVPGAPGVDKPFMLGLSGGERVQVVTPDMRRQIEEQDNERQGTQDNRTQHVHIYVDREAMGQQGRADPEIAGRNLARVVARQLGRM